MTVGKVLSAIRPGGKGSVVRLSASIALVLAGALAFVFAGGNYRASAATTVVIHGQSSDCDVDVTVNTVSMTADASFVSGCVATRPAQFRLMVWAAQSATYSTSQPQTLYGLTTTAPWTLSLPPPSVSCFMQVDFGELRTSPAPNGRLYKSLVGYLAPTGACGSGTTTTTTGATTTTTGATTTTTTGPTTTTTGPTTTTTNATTTTTTATGATSELAADIFICNNGTPTTQLAPTAGASVSAPSTPTAATGVDDFDFTAEDPQTVVVTGHAPTGWQFVACGTNGASATALSAQSALAAPFSGGAFSTPAVAAPSVAAQSVHAAKVVAPGANEQIFNGGIGATEVLTMPAGGEGLAIFYVTQAAAVTTTTAAAGTSTTTVAASTSTTATPSSSEPSDTSVGQATTSPIVETSASNGLAFTGVRLFSELAVVAGLLGLGLLVLRSSRFRQDDQDQS